MLLKAEILRRQSKHGEGKEEPTQASVDKDTWVDIYPIAFVSDTGPNEFQFEEKHQEILDLTHTFLYATVQLVKSDGSEIDGCSKVARVNLFLHSLFGQLDINLNGRTISDGSGTCPYQDYLKTLLAMEKKLRAHI